MPAARTAPAAAAVRRVAARVALVGRTGWPLAALLLAAGAASAALLPVADAWLAGAVAASLAVLALGLLAIGEVLPPPGGPGREPSREPGVAPEAVLERSNGAQQVGHALGRAAFALLGFTAGLAVSRVL